MDDPKTEPNDQAAPDLDDAVAEQVRSLLAEASSAPMPPEVEARVLAALDAERTRPVAGARVAEVPRRPALSDPTVLHPGLRRREPSRPILAAAAVAAAAAVVAVGGSALHLSQRSPGPAVAVVAATPTGSAPSPGSSMPTTAATTTPRTTPGAAPRVHIQLSSTAYDATTLPGLARALLGTPGVPLREGAAEAPSLGPVATEIGLRACLGALGAPDGDAVSADLATYAGEPAAIIVVTTGDSSIAYAVRRHCTTGDAQVLLGATPVP